MVSRPAVCIQETDKMIKCLLVAAYLAAIGVLVSPPAAMAIPGEVDGYVAVNQPGSVAIHQGETVPVTTGVFYNAHLYSFDGAIMHVSVAGDLNLPRAFTNCWYYVNRDTKGAWCLFTNTLIAGTVYQPTPFTVAADRYARADRVGDIAVAWDYLSGAPDMSALERLAAQDSGPGTALIQGSSGTLGLTPATQLTITGTGPANGTAHVHLIGPFAQSPSTVTPDATPTTPPTVTATATAAAGTPGTGPATTPDTPPASAPEGGQYTHVTAQPTSTHLVPAAKPASGGSLASTGPNTSAAAIVAAGCFLTLAGMIVSRLVARRRRKFIA
jgi:hypothetical protein